uniref:Protein disulfide-isomerase n=1 Tax=Steinernema glaseri TaxID=37863 RepID=A0A1I7ZFR2_9BILA
MTTMLKVYHRYISSDNEKEFCQQYGIFRDAIFDAELQFSSVIGEGKSMRMCANLERAYRNREQFREAICRHMFCAKLDTVSQKYKIQNVPHFADVKETDAVYVNPKDEARRHMKILCDGLISTVPGKNFLVNTMLCPDDSIEDANPPSTTHGSVGQAPLDDGRAPETDAVYVNPKDEARRRMKILCDGLISTVPGKNYLVNTMLCPDDSIEDANPPSTTHGSVGQAPLADGLAPVDTGPRNDARDMNPDWY